MDEKLAEESYKFVLAFIRWKKLTAKPNVDLDEVTESWGLLMDQEAIVRKVIDEDT